MACVWLALLLVSTALWAPIDGAAAGMPGPSMSADEMSRLQAAAETIDPEAVILRPDEVHWAACGMKSRDPVVKGDFDGDGRGDYVALLRIGEPREVSTGSRPPYQGVDVWLVVFLAEARGRFRRIALDQLWASPLPVDVAIDLRSPGLVRDFAGPDKDVTLTQPGIGVQYCEKAGKVVYWHQKSRRFREVWTGD